MPTTAADELQEALAPMVILLVGAEVVGQVVDAIGHDRHLDARRAGVGLVGAILVDRRCLFESHDVYSCADAAGGLSARIALSVAIYVLAAPL